MFPRKDTSMQSRTSLAHHSKWKQYWCFSLFYCTADRSVRSSHQPAPSPCSPSRSSSSLSACWSICLSLPCSSRPGRPPKRCSGAGIQESPRLLHPGLPGLLSPNLLSHTGNRRILLHLLSLCATFLSSTPRPSAPTLNYFQLGRENGLDIEALNPPWRNVVWNQWIINDSRNDD